MCFRLRSEPRFSGHLSSKSPATGEQVVSISFFKGCAQVLKAFLPDDLSAVKKKYENGAVPVLPLEREFGAPGKALDQWQLRGRTGPDSTNSPEIMVNVYPRSSL